MSNDRTTGHRSRLLGPLAGAGSRAAAATLRPFADVASSAAWTALDSPQLQAAAKRALESAGARQLLDIFFDSELFDALVDRLVSSPALWRLIEEVVESPAVTAAITRQGLSYADQVSGEVRSRSRGADDWLERAARRLARRPQRPPPAPIANPSP